MGVSLLLWVRLTLADLEEFSRYLHLDALRANARQRDKGCQPTQWRSATNPMTLAEGSTSSGDQASIEPYSCPRSSFALPPSAFEPHGAWLGTPTRNEKQGGSTQRGNGERCRVVDVTALKPAET